MEFYDSIPLSFEVWKFQLVYLVKVFEQFDSFDYDIVRV